MPEPSNHTDGLTVQQADALWDAVAIPGPHTPTFPEQHERVCRAVAGILAELPPPADRSAVLREIADFVRGLLLTRTLVTTTSLEAELRRMADEAQDAKPWLTDSARIGRTLIWSWADVGKGAFREGYRAAQAEARALLGGERGTEAPE
jgi:hypothetical protein